MINIFKKHTNFLVFLIYIILTLVLTVPVVFDINEKIPGKHDAFETYSRAFQNEEKTIHEYFFNDPEHLFKNIFNVRSYIFILHQLVGDPLAYNLIWLLSFLFSSFGAYLLCRCIIKNKFASFAGGLIYGFSPLHFAYAMPFGGAGHIEFIPFFILCYYKYLKSIRIRYFTLSILFFMLIFVNEPHFALYTTLFIILFSPYYFFKNKLYKNKKFIATGIVFAIASIIFGLYTYWGMIKISFSSENFLDPGIQAASTFSNDIVALFTPGRLHPLWGNFFNENIATKYFTGNAAEWTTYIGIINLFFLIVAIINFKKNKHTLVWLGIFLSFLIMSLGPYLHFMGTLTPKIPMPYLLLREHVPFFENIRAVSRLFIYSFVALSILAALGLKHFINKYKLKNKYYKYIIIAISLLVVLDFWTVPENTSVKIPAFFQELKNNEEKFSIIEPQIAKIHAVGSYSRYYNSIHNKNLIGDHAFARENPNANKFEKNTPVINNLIYGYPYGYPTNDFISHDYKNISNFILNRYKIKYIVLYKNYANTNGSFGNFIKLNSFIKENINTDKYIDDKDLLVYEIKKQTNKEKPLILQKNDGWSDVTHDDDGIFMSSMKNQSTTIDVKNYSNSRKNVLVKLTTRGANNFRKLKVLFNNDKVGEYWIGKDQKNINLYLTDIRSKNNVLEFSILDEKGKEINISSKDNVYLNIKYQEIDEINIPVIYNSLEDLGGNILQIPTASNYGNQSNIIKNKTIEYEELIAQYLPLQFNKVLESDGLKSFKASLKEDNSLKQNIFESFNNLDIRYIEIDKTSLDNDQLSELLSIFAFILDSKEIVENSDERIIIKINSQDKNKTVEWSSNFENNNLKEWDIITGAQNKLSLIEDYYEDAAALKINYGFGETFNGLIKNFNYPAKEAEAEGYFKIDEWARGYTDLYFDFIYNVNNYLNYPKLISSNNYLITDYYRGKIKEENNEDTFGHNLSLGDWNKIKISRDKNGVFTYYENDQKIITSTNKDNPKIYGLKVGVSGCCKKSKIDLKIDNFKLRYN